MQQSFSLSDKTRCWCHEEETGGCIPVSRCKSPEVRASKGGKGKTQRIIRYVIVWNSEIHFNFSRQSLVLMHDKLETVSEVEDRHIIAFDIDVQRITSLLQSDNMRKFKGEKLPAIKNLLCFVIGHARL